MSNEPYILSFHQLSSDSLAQAGGNQPENLDKALDSVTEWIVKRL